MTRPTFGQHRVDSKGRIIEDQRAARDEAIEAVADRSATWRSFALRALLQAARQLDELTSDDVWRILNRQGIPAPTEPRAMGPIMLAGVRRGWLARTGRTRIADHPASPNHMRPQAVYRSLERQWVEATEAEKREAWGK